MRRILVAHADARSLAGGKRAPLTVAVVRWRGVDERLSLLVKLALKFDAAADELRVGEAPTMQPRKSDETDQLTRPVDFVFCKHHCDVLVGGHAHAAEPQGTIAARLCVDALDLSFDAIAPGDEPTLDVPLAPRWVRDAQQQPIELGPYCPQREHADDLVEGFDHRGGQCAPPHMQLKLLSSTAEIVLEGLSPRRRKRNLQLPGLVPRVWHEGSTGLFPLNMSLDTLLLDTDFEYIELSWRAVLPNDVSDRNISRIIVSLEREAEPRDEEHVLGLLPRGSFFFASEEHNVADGDPDDLEMARYEALEYAAEPELAVDAFATITARLAEGDRSRTDVLDDAGYDEHNWGIEERAHAEVMGAAASKGDGRPSTDMGEAFVRAQDALVKEGEPRSIADYARFKVALERSDEPKKALAELDITMGEWMRLERHYNTVAANDHLVAATLDEAITSARTTKPADA